MGTQFRVTIYAADIRAGQRAVAAAFQRAAELDAKLSDYRPDSELNRLCRERRLDVSEDLYNVLHEAQAIAKATKGAFDITLGPQIRRWREARRTGVLPSDKPPLVSGYKRLKLQGHTATLAKPGMQLDPGGIAKGYAAQEMLLILRQAGFPRALIAASGDLAIGDPPPDQTGWRVDLPSKIELLRNCHVSTSGDESQSVTIGGIRYSHIVDPHTGLGLTPRPPTTVIAPTGMLADALATALQVDPTLAKRLRNRYPQLRILSNKTVL